jgi:hypothetical protein
MERGLGIRIIGVRRVIRTVIGLVRVRVGYWRAPSRFALGLQPRPASLPLAPDMRPLSFAL